jgi:hypothetical protein
MDPIKVKAVKDWTPPTKLKKVRSFIGFANFYQCFIKDFSKICQPLHNLTKKDVPFVWGPAQQAAFKISKPPLSSNPFWLSGAQTVLLELKLMPQDMPPMESSRRNGMT